MKILAPHSLPQTATELPNPEWGDSDGHSVSLVRHATISGAPITYVKTTGSRKLTYSWQLSREKAEELYAFCKAYSGEVWRIYDHNNEVWKVRLLTDPIVLTKGNLQTITLDFEGEKIG